MDRWYHTMEDTAVKCSSEVNRFALITSPKYQGKEEAANSTPLGICTRVVNNLQVIRNNSDVTQPELFFDNFFSRYKFLTSLACQSIRAVGIVREIRINHATQNMKSQNRVSDN